MDVTNTQVLKFLEDILIHELRILDNIHRHFRDMNHIVLAHGLNLIRHGHMIPEQIIPHNIISHNAPKHVPRMHPDPHIQPLVINFILHLSNHLDHIEPEFNGIDHLVIQLSPRPTVGATHGHVTVSNGAHFVQV